MSKQESKQRSNSVSNAETERWDVVIEIDRTPRGELKALGGGDSDQ